MPKGKRRISEAEKKRQRLAMQHAGGTSAYALKRKYLDKKGGWGFQYDAPKPWKRSSE